MINIALVDLIPELEAVVKSSSAHRRFQIMHQMTRLFVSGVERLNDHHIALYDDVFVRLMERCVSDVLARLSSTFTDMPLAPKQAIRNLAIHEDAVAAAGAG